MILFHGFEFGGLVHILPHEAKGNVGYNTQIQNDLGFEVRENLQLVNTDKKPH